MSRFVNGLCCSVYSFSQSLLFPMSHIHVDTTSSQVFSSVCALSTRSLASHLQSHIQECGSQHHNDVDMAAEQRCQLHSLDCLDHLTISVTMAATDELLQKLGKPPIFSGKEDDWSEWGFVMKSYMSLLSTHVPALLTGAKNPATSPDMSIAAIRATLAEDGVTAAKKLFHV